REGQHAATTVAVARRGGRERPVEVDVREVKELHGGLLTLRAGSAGAGDAAQGGVPGRGAKRQAPAFDIASRLHVDGLEPREEVADRCELSGDVAVDGFDYSRHPLAGEARN